MRKFGETAAEEISIMPPPEIGIFPLHVYSPGGEYIRSFFADQSPREELVNLARLYEERDKPRVYSASVIFYTGPPSV